MTQTKKIYNYGDRDTSEAMRQKGGVQGRRTERQAEQKAAYNPHAKRTTAGDSPRYRGTQFAAIGLD